MKKEFWNKSKKFLEENSSTLLTGIGLIGMFSTFGYLVGISTPRTIKILKEHEQSLTRSKNQKADSIRLVWKEYIPPIIMLIASSGCVIGANIQNIKKNAALISAYMASEVKAKGKELEHSNKNEEKPTIVFYDKSDMVNCYDEFSGRYFESSMRKLENAANIGNQILAAEGYFSLNSFYNEIGLSQLEIADGYGWSINDRTGKSIPIILQYDGAIDQNGHPYLAVHINPVYDYDGL